MNLWAGLRPASDLLKKHPDASICQNAGLVESARVLVVEDDRSIRQGLVIALEDAGHKTTAVADGAALR